MKLKLAEVRTILRREVVVLVVEFENPRTGPRTILLDADALYGLSNRGQRTGRGYSSSTVAAGLSIRKSIASAVRAWLGRR